MSPETYQIEKTSDKLAEQTTVQGVDYSSLMLILDINPTQSIIDDQIASGRVLYNGESCALLLLLQEC